MSVNTPPAKWLRTLFYLHIGMLAATCLSWLPIQDLWVTWLKRILIIGTVFCLYQLSSLNEHYRKAMIFRFIYIAGVLITPLVFRASLIVLAVSVFSILGAYQEYHGHSRLIAEKDPVLSGKWERFFGWALLVELLMSFGSSILSVVSVLMGFDLSEVIATVMITISLPRLIIDIFYLVYMNRTVRLLEAEEGDFYDN